MRVIKVISGLLIWTVAIPFSILGLVTCCTIVGLPIGLPMFLFSSLLGAIGWRLISGKPVNYTSMKEEKYAARAAKRDARHNAKFA